MRALLAMRMDYARATRIAANVGKGAAVLFGFVGLLSNPFLLLIAVFVWFGATQESAAVQARSALDGVPVEAAMMTDYASLDRSDPVNRAVEVSPVTVGPREMLEVALDRMQAAGCPMAPVVAGGRTVGLLTLDNVVEYLSFRRALADRKSLDGGTDDLFGSQRLDLRAGSRFAGARESG